MGLAPHRPDHIPLHSRSVHGVTRRKNVRDEDENEQEIVFLIAQAQEKCALLFFEVGV